MKVLFVEGPDAEPLRSLARAYPYPYRLLQRPQQGLYLLEVWAMGSDIQKAAQSLHGFRSWDFELLEEGQG